MYKNVNVTINSGIYKLQVLGYWGTNWTTAPTDLPAGNSKNLPLTVVIVLVFSLEFSMLIRTKKWGFQMCPLPVPTCLVILLRALIPWAT